MRACIHCGEAGGTRIGGPCISCEYDDSDCDELVAEAKSQAAKETSAAIAAWMRREFRHTVRKETLEAIEQGDWAGMPTVVEPAEPRITPEMIKVLIAEINLTARLGDRTLSARQVATIIRRWARSENK
jgi:hypothetical protein